MTTSKTKHSGNTIFLKLGGSLITDKSQPYTTQDENISRLAEEIAEALRIKPALRLIVGHGAGSFGHVSASKYGTRKGVSSADDWQGFAEVWRDASTLNHIIMKALQLAGLPAIAIHPSSCVVARDGKVETWDIKPLIAALDAGLIPVIHGDVTFDRDRGGTILSTEDIFTFLAKQLKPKRILLAGCEEGVWEDYPDCKQMITQITPENFHDISYALRGSATTDVTGGMLSKVEAMLNLVQEVSNLQVCIFSGDHPQMIQQSLNGKSVGTLISR